MDLPVSSAQRAANRRREIVASAYYELGLFVDGPIENRLGLHSMQSQRLTLDLGYGLTRWLAPSVAMPFVWNTLDAQIGDRREARSVFGLGDASLLLKLTIVGARAYAPGDLRVWVAPGVEVPTGSYTVEDDFGRLPPQAQPGSGSWDVLAAAFASIGLTGEAGRLLLLNSVVVKLPTENPEGLRAGHTLELASLAQLSLSEALSLRLGPVLRIAASDRVRPPGAPTRAVDNSGGRVLLGRLGMAWAFVPDAALGLDVQTPIVRDVNGEQLHSVVTATLGLIIGWQ